MIGLTYLFLLFSRIPMEPFKMTIFNQSFLIETYWNFLLTCPNTGYGLLHLANIKNNQKINKITWSLCDCKSLSLYFGRKLRNWILEENSWVWKIWTEEEWEVEVKIWTTLTYHKVEWGYRSESEKIVLSKVNEVVVEKWSLMTHGEKERKGKNIEVNVYML